MEMFSPDIHFILLVTVAFLAGLVDAIAGGGGLIMIPALLTVGMPPHITLGTNKLAATFGSSTAAWVCVRKGIFIPKMWKMGIIATFIGALLGTLATTLTSPDLLKKGLPVVIVCVALYALLRRPPVVAHPVSNPSKRTLTSMILGSTLGFYDGFIGPGTGIFWTSAVLTCYSTDLVEASAVARFMNFISNIVSLSTFILLSSVNFTLGISLGLALMLGAYVGVHSALRFGAPFIRPLFILVVLATTARLVWLEWC